MWRISALLLVVFLVVSPGSAHPTGPPSEMEGGQAAETQIRIQLTSILVNDQAAALRFYTEVLGFTKKEDIPVGEYRWLSVTSPAGAEGVELLLEPNAHPAAAVFQKAIYEDGIPATVFLVEDLQAEYERLRDLDVVFTTPPVETPYGWQAVFDDTCGNLIVLHQE